MLVGVFMGLFLRVSDPCLNPFCPVQRHPPPNIPPRLRPRSGGIEKPPVTEGRKVTGGSRRGGRSHDLHPPGWAPAGETVSKTQQSPTDGGRTTHSTRRSHRWKVFSSSPTTLPAASYSAKA